MADITGTPGDDVLNGTADADIIDGGDGNDSLFAHGGGDFVYGGAGDDSLDADGGDDFLYGGEGSDFLDAADGQNLLDGGSGDDTLIAGDGNDTYVFGPGYGADFVSDAGGTDRVVVDGLTPAEVRFERAGDDIVMTVTGTGDRLTLSNWFTPGSRIESIEFSASETMLDAATIERIVNNAAPVATDDSATIAEDAASPVTGNVLANDSDANATDFVQVTNAGTYQGLYGTLELAADGSYTYTLDSSLAAVQGLAQGETLTESFTYEVSDDVPLYAGTASALLNIVIQGADEASSGRHIVGTHRKDRLVGTDGDDLLQGGRGKDLLQGGSGVDILQGGRGKDRLVDRDGSTVFDGGRGKDELTGGGSADFFAGGRGKDELKLGGGSDVIAFNKGDGVDHIEGECQNGVLSLGGGIRYQDLRFRKDGKDLILETGGSDRLVFEDWYKGKHSVVTLQVVAEAMAGFSQSSSNQLLNDRVELFDFRQLVDAFDDARSSKKNMDSWKLMGELLDAHLGGSDDAALGGDLAYRYGMTGTLEGMTWDAARDTVAAPAFGNDLQTIQPLAAAQDDAVKLTA